MSGAAASEPLSPQPLSKEYGDRPPWHDAMMAISGPAVHDVETTFRERWEDPSPLSRHPAYWIADKVRRLDRTPDPLPPQQPPPSPVDGGTHVVQLLRTYPNLRQARDYPFAPGGERSVALGYAKAAKRSRRLIYVEDQYFWGNEIASTFLDALVDNPGLHLMCVLPLYPDLEGSSRTPQLLGRQRAIRDLMEAAPGRVAAYGLENDAGTPVYVHAKLCVMDDAWCTTGSDNFNRRSWTHDSELSAVVVDRADSGSGGDISPYAQMLRLRLAAEHLGRLDRVLAGEDLTDVVPDCLEPEDMVTAYAACADDLETWHARVERLAVQARAQAEAVKLSAQASRRAEEDVAATLRAGEADRQAEEAHRAHEDADVRAQQARTEAELRA